jgi:hypothetical protein
VRGGTYSNCHEILLEVPLPPHVQEQLHECAIV